MSSAALKKAEFPSAYPAATSLFEQLAELFAVPSSNHTPSLEPSRFDASFRALEQAPLDEVAAISQVLQDISARVFKLSERSENLNKSRKHDVTKPPRAAVKAAEREDAMVRGLLAHAHQEPVGAEPTAEQARENAQVMSRLRRESAAALKRRIDSKELLSPREFQEALGISRQSINEAVKAHRMFALLGPAGENYYPAFYADGELNRRQVEKAAKALGFLPPASKYHFFTSKSAYLGSLTPLEALKQGRLDDVLVAAAGFRER